MIYQIQGKLLKKEDNLLIIDLNGIAYEVHTPKTVSQRLKEDSRGLVKLIIYHYLSLDKNRAIPILIGFTENLEKNFFEKFISVSGVGPKAALKAFEKPVGTIACAIESGDLDFLTSLVGIGKQRAKQIVAHLQGKVGRFALIKEETQESRSFKKEIAEEAREILKRLQYTSKEAEKMIKKALLTKDQIENVEELLNEIYRQKT